MGGMGVRSDQESLYLCLGLGSAQQALPLFASEKHKDWVRRLPRQPPARSDKERRQRQAASR